MLLLLPLLRTNVRACRSSDPVSMPAGGHIQVLNFDGISYLLSTEGVSFIERTDANDSLGCFKIDWILYLVAVMLGPGFYGVPFGNKAGVRGFKTDRYNSAINTTQKLAWLAYALPPPVYGYGDEAKHTCLICLASFLVDPHLFRIPAFNKGGSSWNRVTENRCGDILMGLTRDLLFLVYRSTTVERQLELRTGYTGGRPLLGTLEDVPTQKSEYTYSVLTFMCHRPGVSPAGALAAVAAAAANRKPKQKALSAVAECVLAADAAAHVSDPSLLDAANFSKHLSKEQLKQMCNESGLSSAGTISALIARLQGRHLRQYAH